MFARHLLGNYVLIKKSTLCLAALAAASMVACHFYKYHKKEIQENMENFADEAKDVVKTGKQKVKEVVDEAKK